MFLAETEEKLDSLKDSKAILNSIVENSTDQIFLLDRDYKYLIVNKALAAVLGKTSEEIIGKTISDEYPAETAARFKGNVDKVFSTGKNFFLEEKMHAQGQELDISTSLNPVLDDKARIIAVAGIVRDITERKNLEKRLHEEERLAAIGTTAGMVGHDIRNPLQAIMGDLFLIEQEVNANRNCESKDIAENIANINENIYYINKIVSDLQDYTRIIEPSLTEINLKNLIINAIEGHKIPDEIKFQVDIEDNVLLKTDPTYLKRIIANLFRNALQAMPQGGKLTIKAYREESMMTITVEDTGVGIEDNDIPQLFKPLFTTKAKGQGLGLAVVKRFVEALNGTISLDTHVGKGTKFTIRLPLKS
jgi:PAS domain S-box-containing protein